MPNDKRVDEITARFKVILDADIRLDDNLSETPTVYDSMPKPESPPSVYRIYIDPMVGWRLYETQTKTAMTFLTLEVTIRFWMVIYNDLMAAALSDFWKLQDNLLKILGDYTVDGDYWYAGMPQLCVPSASHQNLDESGDVRYRIGYIDFTLLQDKNL